MVYLLASALRVGRRYKKEATKPIVCAENARARANFRSNYRTWQPAGAEFRLAYHALRAVLQTGNDGMLCLFQGIVTTKGRLLRSMTGVSIGGGKGERGRYRAWRYF